MAVMAKVMAMAIAMAMVIDNPIASKEEPNHANDDTHIVPNVRLAHKEGLER